MSIMCWASPINWAAAAAAARSATTAILSGRTSSVGWTSNRRRLPSIEARRSPTRPLTSRSPRCATTRSTVKANLIGYRRQSCRLRRRSALSDVGSQGSPPDRSSGEPQDALGHDVALDLVGAGVDRTGQGELEALVPRPFELGLGTKEPEGRLVHTHVELGPEELGQA